MSQAQWKIKTQFGDLYLIASEKGLKQVHWRREPKIEMLASLEANTGAARILAQADRQFREYFAGDRREFDLPFDVEGTAFQKSVWHQLSRIPYGQTCSYKDIAKRIGNPGAVRAVGSANGKNPLAIIVPCHRVIAADGSLGGYSGGLGYKKRLLALEKGGDRW
jgi:methylated-DNA-[protein]-cysteine S-methyltransferase